MYSYIVVAGVCTLRQEHKLQVPVDGEVITDFMRTHF